MPYKRKRLMSKKEYEKEIFAEVFVDDDLKNILNDDREENITFLTNISKREKEDVKEDMAELEKEMKKYPNNKISQISKIVRGKIRIKFWDKNERV